MTTDFGMIGVLTPSHKTAPLTSAMDGGLEIERGHRERGEGVCERAQSKSITSRTQRSQTKTVRRGREDRLIEDKRWGRRGVDTRPFNPMHHASEAAHRTDHMHSRYRYLRRNSLNKYICQIQIPLPDWGPPAVVVLEMRGGVYSGMPAVAAARWR